MDFRRRFEVQFLREWHTSVAVGQFFSGVPEGTRLRTSVTRPCGTAAKKERQRTLGPSMVSASAVSKNELLKQRGLPRVFGRRFDLAFCQSCDEPRARRDLRRVAHDRSGFLESRHRVPAAQHRVRAQRFEPGGD